MINCWWGFQRILTAWKKFKNINPLLFVVREERYQKANW